MTNEHIPEIERETVRGVILDTLELKIYIDNMGNRIVNIDELEAFHYRNRNHIIKDTSLKHDDGIERGYLVAYDDDPGEVDLNELAAFIKQRGS
jgi:hypothetical protein